MTQAQAEADQAPAAAPDLVCHLDDLLHERRLTAVELAHRVGIHPNNLSQLRQGRFSMLRRTTLVALCRELGCQPGDLLTYG
jgi:putative transcriptional regulator